MNREGVRIVLLGKTGTGKSATGNTILGREQFHSEYSMNSVTRACKKGSTDRFDTPVSVVDTPGLFDTEMSNEEVTKEIVRVVSMTAPGPHAFLLTLKPGRFTEEERNTIKRIQDQFGNDMLKYTIIVFTGIDELQRNNCSLETYLQRAPAMVQELVQECNNRYIGMNNTADISEKDIKIRELLRLAWSLKDVNGSPYYTDAMFEEAKRALERVEEEQRRKAEEEQLAKEAELRGLLEAEKQREIELMQNDFQEQVNQMKISEEERQRREEELRKQLEESSKNRLNEMMAEFQKQQEEQHKKEHNMRLQMAQAEVEKARLQAEKEMEAMKLQHERQMEDARRQSEQRAAQLEKERIDVQMNMQLSKQQADLQIAKLQEQMQRNQQESAAKIQQLSQQRSGSRRRGCVIS